MWSVSRVATLGWPAVATHYSCLLSSALFSRHSPPLLSSAAHRPSGAFGCSVGYHKKIFFFHRGCSDRLLGKNHSSLSPKACTHINGLAHGLAFGVLLLSMWEVLLMCNKPAQCNRSAVIMSLGVKGFL